MSNYGTVFTAPDLLWKLLDNIYIYMGVCANI